MEPATVGNTTTAVDNNNNNEQQKQQQQQQEDKGEQKHEPPIGQQQQQDHDVIIQELLEILMWDGTDNENQKKKKTDDATDNNNNNNNIDNHNTEKTNNNKEVLVLFCERLQVWNESIEQQFLSLQQQHQQKQQQQQRKSLQQQQSLNTTTSATTTTTSQTDDDNEQKVITTRIEKVKTITIAILQLFISGILSLLDDNDDDNDATKILVQLPVLKPISSRYDDNSIDVDTTTKNRTKFPPPFIQQGVDHEMQYSFQQKAEVLLSTLKKVVGIIRSSTTEKEEEDDLLLIYQKERTGYQIINSLQTKLLLLTKMDSDTNALFLPTILRTCQNWIRYYVPFYEPTLLTQQLIQQEQHKKQDTTTTTTTTTTTKTTTTISTNNNQNHHTDQNDNLIMNNVIELWKTRTMFEIYVHLIRILTSLIPILCSDDSSILDTMNHHPSSNIHNQKTQSILLSTSTHSTVQPIILCCRYVCQVLFYTSYSNPSSSMTIPSPSLFHLHRLYQESIRKKLQETYQYLIKEYHLFHLLQSILLMTQTIVLPMLTSESTLDHDNDYDNDPKPITTLRTNTITLQLSVLRIVQNIVVAIPFFVPHVLDTKFQSFINNTNNNTNNNSNQSIENTTSIHQDHYTCFPDTLWNILDYHVGTTVHHEKFPGQKENRRTELVIDIVRVLYALKVTKDLTKYDTHKLQILSTIMSLDSSKSGMNKERNSSSNSSSKQHQQQCYDCQVATLCLFMDTNQEVNEYLMKQGTQFRDTFLHIFERQIRQMFATTSSSTTTITTSGASTNKTPTIIAQAAAAASPAAEAGVLPIFIVLNQFCQFDKELCNAVKEHIFQDEGTHFRTVSIYNVNQTTNANQTATSMKPIIEPIFGTLHYYVNQLITYYHNSFIKRLVNELVYTLCHHDANEFIVRIGLGNALPFLNTKGIINLPTKSSMITTTTTTTPKSS